MEKATNSEGDRDHLSHLASYMECNNIAQIVTDFELRLVQAMRRHGAQTRTEEGLYSAAMNLSLSR